jgi:PPOX class probable FMN-dependent enzyme
VLLPDRRGNNRLDSLRNIVENGGIGLLFLIPGINVTMRLNGTARLVTDVPLRESFAVSDKVPATVIEVTVGEVYTQCPKALVRSRLWDIDGFQTHATVPTVGEVMAEITNGEFDGVSYDASYPKHMKKTIY